MSGCGPKRACSTEFLDFSGTRDNIDYKTRSKNGMCQSIMREHGLVRCIDVVIFFCYVHVHCAFFPKGFSFQ